MNLFAPVSPIPVTPPPPTVTHRLRGLKEVPATLWES